MSKEFDSSLIEVDVLKAERFAEDHLKSSDPGKMDFSEDFFNQLHDKIMSQVEQTEILPKPGRNRRSLPRLWQSWRDKKFSKGMLPLMALALLVISGALISDRSAPAKVTLDVFLEEAIRSPEDFATLVAGSLGQNDFLVDVASRNFDHVNIHDFDNIFGTSSAEISPSARSSQKTP
jgi:hypothetical protein